MPSTLEGRIQANLQRIREQIDLAAARVGRDPNTVRILAVAKSQPAESVRAAYAAGLRLIGENRVEEAEPKQFELRDLTDLQWHMVGQVQSRKAGKVTSLFSVVHSVDRWKLAGRLDREAGARGARLQVLLECNVSGEASKSGWRLADPSVWAEAAVEFSQLADLPNLEVRGLMTMAPRSEGLEGIRPVFLKLRALRDFLERATSRGWPELSMGMSDDFTVAVEAGATMVRLGRVIFGPRPGP